MAGIPQLYQGLEGIQVLCLVQADGKVAAEETRNRICDALAREATHGTDLPVERIELGDPRVLAADRLTILAHAAILEGDRVAITIRPYRPSQAGSDILFGAMPRVALISDEAALARVLAVSLDEILPWRTKQSGARLID